MTTSGQRATRRIVEAMAVLEGSSNTSDVVRKAAKVLEDRWEKNAAASIILLSDVPAQSSHVSSTRYSHSHLDVALHTVKLAKNDDQTFVKSIRSLLNVAVQDLKLDLKFVSGSSPAEITAVYSYAPKPVALGSGKIRIREMCANEERELLITSWSIILKANEPNEKTHLSPRKGHTTNLTPGYLTVMAPGTVSATFGSPQGP